LVKEQQAYHREFINSQQPDPKLYSVGNIVFAPQAICSNANRGQVDKLTYPFTGPWRITAKLHSALYKLEHCSTKSKEKKHASNLSPYHTELIPFQHLDSTDNHAGQLYWKFKEHPYKEAGIKGFTPLTLFSIPTQFLRTSNDLLFKRPTLAKLNNEPFPDLCQADKDNIAVANDTIELASRFYIGPPPSAPTCSIPSTSSANILAHCIINSTNKLFFISWKIGGSVEDIHKWQLVQVALAVMMQSYPLCLDNRQYAIDFYIAHPSDFRYNGIYQHASGCNTIARPICQGCALCLVRTSSAPPTHPKLMLSATSSFHYIVSSILLTQIHTSIVLLTSPLLMAGKVWTRYVNPTGISFDLRPKCLFHDPLPPSAVPSYLVHVDYCSHTTFHNLHFSRNVCSLPQPEETISDVQLYP
jgi:hypothetical protein